MFLEKEFSVFVKKNLTILFWCAKLKHTFPLKLSGSKETGSRGYSGEAPNKSAEGERRKLNLSGKRTEWKVTHKGILFQLWELPERRLFLFLKRYFSGSDVYTERI